MAAGRRIALLGLLLPALPPPPSHAPPHCLLGRLAALARCLANRRATYNTLQALHALASPPAPPSTLASRTEHPGAVSRKPEPPWQLF